MKELGQRKRELLTKCTDSATDDEGLYLVLNAHATMLAHEKTLSK